VVLQVRPAVEGVRLVPKRAVKVRANRALWAVSYSSKESFSFSIRWMVSSPRTVSNLHKNVPNHDLNNSVAQFFVASQLHCVFCARQRLWRWRLKSLFA